MGYNDCYKALIKKAWTINIDMVHNEYDNTEITFGNWGQYFTNLRPDCFTHCYLNKCTADPNNNGGSCNYIK